MTTSPVTQPAEQLLYARWLQRGARLGMALLALLFLFYAAGWGAPQLTPRALVQVWGQPLSQFLQSSGVPTGWGWLQPALRRGATDLACLLGLVVLAGCSLPALGMVLLHAWRQGDKRMAWLCAAQVLVLLVAASGVLVAGGRGGHGA